MKQNTKEELQIIGTIIFFALIGFAFGIIYAEEYMQKERNIAPKDVRYNCYVGAPISAFDEDDKVQTPVFVDEIRCEAID